MIKFRSGGESSGGEDPGRIKSEDHERLWGGVERSVSGHTMLGVQRSGIIWGVREKSGGMEMEADRFRESSEKFRG